MRIGKLFSRALPLAIFVFILEVSVPASAQGLFALDVNPRVVETWHQEPWPEVSFGSLRLWDANVSWYQINPADGVYDWSLLDAWLAAAQAGGSTGGGHVLYTFGRTPQWASSNPNDKACAAIPGGCDPPNDLNPDGSGSNQHWKNFVTALALHSKNSSTAHIEAWELWNEPFATWQWNGTQAQLVRMARDAYSIIKGIDPEATVLSPSVDWAWAQPMRWMADYFAAGGGQYADAIAVHGYVHVGKDHDEPEDMVAMSQKFRAVLKAHSQDTKAIWDTEGSWGHTNNTHYKDPDMQAGWLARFYILHRSNSISRLFWYSYNCDKGLARLWIPDPKDRSLPGTLLKPGKAFEEVRYWLVGAKMTTSCSAQGTIWTCGLTRPRGDQDLIIWDTNGICAKGKCQTANYSVASQYVKYRTLDGDVIPVTNGSVPIGAKPILVRNH